MDGPLDTMISGTRRGRTHKKGRGKLDSSLGWVMTMSKEVDSIIMYRDRNSGSNIYTNSKCC